jgi:hypothetical protein
MIVRSPFLSSFFFLSLLHPPPFLSLKANSGLLFASTPASSYVLLPSFPPIPHSQIFNVASPPLFSPQNAIDGLVIGDGEDGEPLEDDEDAVDPEDYDEDEEADSDDEPEEGTYVRGVLRRKEDSDDIDME